MSAVRLRIDHLAVEIGEEEMRVGEAEETVRKALALLASRLATAPLGAGEQAPGLALDLLDLGPLDPGWLAGPGAAARLADELYRRIVGGRHA